MDNSAAAVALGSHVQVELVSQTGQRESLAFDLVPDPAADFASGLLSMNTPLARAILGQTPGNTVPYRIGDLVEVKIVSITALFYPRPSLRQSQSDPPALGVNAQHDDLDHLAGGEAAAGCAAHLTLV